jgi:hypothetical protein
MPLASADSSYFCDASLRSVTNADDLAKVAVRLDLSEHEVRDIST